MKTMIKTTIVLAFLALSCNSKTHTSAAAKDQVAQTYACPMHPEVTGAKGEKCSECGMELTEPVASKSAAAPADDAPKEQDSIN